MKNKLNTENKIKSKSSPQKTNKPKNNKKNEIPNKSLIDNNINKIIKKDKIKNNSLISNKTLNINKFKNEKNKNIKQNSTKQFYSEHYDLPSTYEKTYSVLVAQNPNTLFAFWEISELDKQKLKEKYGSSLFQNTKPILIVINKTLSINFEIEINEFATNWYINVDHTNCEYEIQLGLKPYNDSEDEFILITNSNSVLCPNDNVIFEKLPKKYDFFNIDSNTTTRKKIETNNFENIYNIYDFYLENHLNELTNNPSSKMNNTNFD